jgi:hypothetical protein
VGQTHDGTQVPCPAVTVSHIYIGSRCRCAFTVCDVGHVTIPGDEVRVAPKMAGPLWRFGRGERAKRRCLPEMSRGLLIPVRAAPFCVLQLEVWVPLNHFGTLRDASLSRRHWSATAFAAQSRNQCRSLKAAKPRVLPAWLGPGAGNRASNIVSRRID